MADKDTPKACTICDEDIPIGKEVEKDYGSKVFYCQECHETEEEMALENAADDDEPIPRATLRERYLMEIEYAYDAMTDPIKGPKLQEGAKADFFDYAEFVGHFLVGLSVITHKDHRVSLDRLREAEAGGPLPMDLRPQEG